MNWTFEPHANTIRRHGDSGLGAADRLLCPLVFSVVGWLVHGLVLAMQGEAFLTSLSLALILGAAPLAAILALRCVGDADEIVP
jgi:hypothetical protein